MEYGLGPNEVRSGKTQWILSVSVSPERETEIRLKYRKVPVLNFRYRVTSTGIGSNVNSAQP